MPIPNRKDIAHHGVPDMSVGIRTDVDLATSRARSHGVDEVQFGGAERHRSGADSPKNFFTQIRQAGRKAFERKASHEEGMVSN